MKTAFKYIFELFSYGPFETWTSLSQFYPLKQSLVYGKCSNEFNWVMISIWHAIPKFLDVCVGRVF